MDKVFSSIKNNKFNLIILFIYLIILSVMLFHHEIWRDEAQVWCLVRDCSLSQVFEMAKVEGHPMLWYIFICPFAKLGFNVISMQIISLLTVFLSVVLLLFKFNLTNFQKTVMVFNAGFLYYLPVISRNYALIPLILFLIAFIYPKREQKPFLYTVLIILLSATHNYMLGLAFILFLVFAFENIKNKNYKIFLSLILLLLNFLFIFLSFYSAYKLNYALETREVQTMSFLKLITFMSQVWAYPIINLSEYLIKYALPLSILSFVPFSAVIMFCFIKQNRKIGLICLFAVAFILYAFSNIYFNGILYQKLFLIPLIFIFSYILLKAENIETDRLLNVSLNILLLISLFVAPIVMFKDIKYNFSGGKQTADYIKANLNGEKTFIAIGNPYLYSSISAYLPDKRIYSIVSNNYISYYTYKSDEEKNMAEFPEDAKYFIVDEKVKNPVEFGFKVIFSSDKNNLSSKTQREVFNICEKAQ